MSVATMPDKLGERSKHWPAWTVGAIYALAAFGALVLLLAGFEVVHWAIEGMPPPAAHAHEFIDHMSAIVGKWMWLPRIRWG